MAEPAAVVEDKDSSSSDDEAEPVPMTLKQARAAAEALHAFVLENYELHEHQKPLQDVAQQLARMVTSKATRQTSLTQFFTPSADQAPATEGCAAAGPSDIGDMEIDAVAAQDFMGLMDETAAAGETASGDAAAP